MLRDAFNKRISPSLTVLNPRFSAKMWQFTVPFYLRPARIKTLLAAASRTAGESFLSSLGRYSASFSVPICPIASAARTLHLSAIIFSCRCEPVRYSRTTNRPLTSPKTPSCVACLKNSLPSIATSRPARQRQPSDPASRLPQAPAFPLLLSSSSP